MDERSPASWKPPFLLRLTAGVHAAAAVGVVLAPSSWPWIAGVLAANHAVLCGAVMAPRSRLLGANLTRLPAASRDRIALTFDDGPDPRVTPRVLDLLDEHSARGTFFCIGRKAEEHPGLVAEIVARGHRVENHSHGHPNSFAFYGPRSQARQVDRAQEALEEITGRRPRFFRPPAGFRNLWLDRVLARRGMRLASWTRRGFDTIDRSPRRVAHRLLRGLAPGDILMLHDGSVARDRQGEPVVLEVLRRVLDEVEAHGWDTDFLPRENPAR